MSRRWIAGTGRRPSGSRWQASVAGEPSMPAGLLHRWRADTLGLANGASVASWPSLEGSNPATLTNATPANQPTYTTAGIGGRPALRFTRTAAQQLSTTVTGGLDSSTTYVMVLDVVTLAASGDSNVLHNGQEIIFPASGTAFAVYGGSLLSGTPGSGVLDPCVLVTTFNGASSFIHKNGTQIASGNAGLSARAPGLILANHAGFARHVDAFISEVMIFDGALSTAERTVVETYARQRYALA